MSGIGTGYDLSATTFSPDGRIFQVEYAQKAVENSGTCVAAVVKDGVVFAVEKYRISKMLVESSNRPVFIVDEHVGMAVCGLLPDSKALVAHTRKECKDYRHTYGHRIPLAVLAKRVSLYVQAYTLYASVRPFGCSVFLGSYNDSTSATPAMYGIEPSGTCVGYYGNAYGKGKQSARTSLEGLDLKNMTARQAVKELAKIIHSVHDDVRDKDFDLELFWVCEESQGVPQSVPVEVVAEADEWAKAQLEEEDDSGDDDDDEAMAA